VPYLAHLLAVAALVLDDGGDGDEAIAALLHDAAEDQGSRGRVDDIRGRFGDRVATIVEACTDTFETPKPPWRPRKDAYLAGLSDAPRDAVRVSLADKLANARALLADYRQYGDELWTRFRGDSDQLSYYRALADAFAALEASAMADELERVVAELERIAAKPSPPPDIEILDAKELEPFTYRWPDLLETFDRGWSLRVRAAGDELDVRYGLARRPAYGRKRVRGGDRGRRRRVPRAATLGAQHDEACGLEVVVEGERLPDCELAHEGEARRVDERVLALVAPTQPVERLLLALARREFEAQARRASELVEETNRRGMPSAPVEPRPRFTADVVGRHQCAIAVPAKQRYGLGVVGVVHCSERDPERRVDEDHSVRLGP
jgi:hypothetical protein